VFLLIPYLIVYLLGLALGMQIPISIEEIASMGTYAILLFLLFLLFLTLFEELSEV